MKIYSIDLKYSGNLNKKENAKNNFMILSKNNSFVEKKFKKIIEINKYDC